MPVNLELRGAYVVDKTGEISQKIHACRYAQTHFEHIA